MRLTGKVVLITNVGQYMLSGTVPTVDGQLIYGDAYELELADPLLDRAIRTQYAVRVLERDPR